MLKRLWRRITQPRRWVWRCIDCRATFSYEYGVRERYCPYCDRAKLVLERARAL